VDGARALGVGTAAGAPQGSPVLRRTREGHVPPISWSFVADVGAALLLGLVIGVERQWRQHPAGLRTNALVALGAALFVGLSSLVGEENRSRIAGQVVTGLGFLGGGVILREGLNVRGLSTAATIWCSGAVGSLAGAGRPLEALVATFCVLGVHLGLRPVALLIDRRTKTATDVETYYRLRVEVEVSQEAHVRHILLRHVGGNPKLNLQGLSSEDVEPGRVVVLADVYAPERSDRAMEDVVTRLSIEPEVKAVSWQRTAA
jgi:putative Mg2+ transporter-C (MgtC) family protein